MEFKIPKNDAKYRWTNHVIRKMGYYGLSPDRVKRVIRHPKRMEQGVAPGTLAGMQEAGSKKNPSEIWVMWAEKKERGKWRVESGNSGSREKNVLHSTIHTLLSGSPKVIITAWRYPGVSPVRDSVPIPADILSEIKDMLY